MSVINKESLVVETPSGFTIRDLTRSEQMRLMDRAGYTTHGVVTVPISEAAVALVEDGYAVTVRGSGECSEKNALEEKRDTALALTESLLKRGYVVVTKSSMTGRSLVADAEFTRLQWAASVVSWPFNAEASEEELLAFADRYPTIVRKVMREADALIVELKNKELENLRHGANGTTHPAE